MSAKAAAFPLLIWYTAIAASQAQVSSFKHIVVIFQENRTPDNLFQGLCAPPFGSSASCSATPTGTQYDIETDNWLDKTSNSGTIHPGLSQLANKYDLDHSHAAFTAMCDPNMVTGACKMDGAAYVSCRGTCPSQPAFRYVNNSSGIVDPYLQLATQYGWANYMFQTNQGPSFPAHQFIFGGTSAPTANDDAQGTFAAENTSDTPEGGAAGCIAPAGTTVQLINALGVEDGSNQIYPCFEHNTLPDVLPTTVTWRYYSAGAGSIWTAPNAIQHICESSGPSGECLGQIWSDHVDVKPRDVLTDISSCKLRNVTWVMPSGQNSDHALINDGGGPSWVASIVNAIGTSSCENGNGYWNDTAILITWDDWGGWYDHEPPTILLPPQGGYQYGFRVPFIAVSPHTPKGYVNNTRHDFGSILRFIEYNFGIQPGALGFADARAQDQLLGFFNFNQKPRPFQKINSEKDESFFLNDQRPLTDPDDQ